MRGKQRGIIVSSDCDSEDTTRILCPCGTRQELPIRFRSFSIFCSRTRTPSAARGQAVRRATSAKSGVLLCKSVCRVKSITSVLDKVLKVVKDSKVFKVFKVFKDPKVVKVIRQKKKKGALAAPHVGLGVPSNGCCPAPSRALLNKSRT